MIEAAKERVSDMNRERNDETDQSGCVPGQITDRSLPVSTCWNRSGFSAHWSRSGRSEKLGRGKAGISDSIHFLKLAGYIETRTIEGRISGADLADYNYDELEARASEKGIRLMQGKSD